MCVPAWRLIWYAVLHDMIQHEASSLGIAGGRSAVMKRYSIGSSVSTLRIVYSYSKDVTDVR